MGHEAVSQFPCISKSQFQPHRERVSEELEVKGGQLLIGNYT